MLKVCVLLLLLCDNKELLENRSFNPLLHDSAKTFKGDTDIQSLYGLIEAFNALNLERF